MGHVAHMTLLLLAMLTLEHRVSLHCGHNVLLGHTQLTSLCHSATSLDGGQVNVGSVVTNSYQSANH